MKFFNTETGEFEDPILHAPGNYDAYDYSLSTGTANAEPSKTNQSSKNEADINTIVKNFGVTGHLPQIPLPPSLDEFAEVFDFQSAMNIQATARHSFMMLPADVRAAFGNDPHNFVSQVDTMLSEEDPERLKINLDDLRAMGLMVPKTPPGDTTTLGDLKAAILAARSSGGSPASEPPNGA